MKKIRDIIYTILLILIILLVYRNIDTISEFFTDLLVSNEKVTIKEANNFDKYGEVQLGNVKNFEITKGEYCIYITCSKCGKTICILV